MTQMRRLLPQLLKAVKREVNARLEQSLHYAIQVNLQQETESQPGQRLWDVEVKIGKRPSYQLAPETSITQVFDCTAGKLLITGAAGAGKTTTLLELARDLIARAENDLSYPIPVLFDLFSWQQQPIIDWFVAELKSKYGINVKMGRKLIERQQLLPLLDGLDELDLSDQDQCLQALNGLLVSENPLKYLALCTRLEDYKSCQTKLRLHGAVYLRPLVETQIREYLMSARSRELWENIKTKPDLLRLAKTPLFLNMMTLAYEEILIHAWKRLNNYQEYLQYLLNAYIRRMLIQETKSKAARRKKKARPEEMRPWLVFLAKRMQAEHQTELMLQKIGSSWLQSQRQKRLHRLGVVLTFGGIFGLKDLILRLILWRQGYMPWRYTRFLNEATERLFLQRVDGRYRFIHEALRSHFAQM